MASRDFRLRPSSLRPALLLLGPLAVLALLLGLFAGSATAAHPVDPPTNLAVQPGAHGTATSPGWTYSIPAGQTADCTLSGPAGSVSVTCPVNGEAAQPVTPLQTDGRYTFRVTTTRAPVTTTDGTSDTPTSTIDEGGTSLPAESTYVLDRVAPALTVGPPASGVPYAEGTGWSVTATDPHLATVTCTLTPPGEAAGSPFPCSGGTRPALSTNGTYTLTATAVDEAKNAATPVSSTYYYDGTAPRVTVQLDTASPSAAQQPAWTIWVDDTTAAVTCRLVGPAGEVATGPCNAGTYTAPTLTTSGSYTLTVTAVDAAGNRGQEGASYVLDLTPPTITVPASSTGTSGTVSWNVTVADATGSSCTVAGATTSTTTCGATGGTVSASLDADGLVRLTVTAVDAHGNSSSASVTYTRVTTPTAPTVLPETTRDNDKQASWTFTVDELTTAVTCQVLLDGLPYTAAGGCTTFDGTAGSHVVQLTDDGAYTLQVTASNSTSPTTATGTATYTLDTWAAPGPGITQTPEASTGRQALVRWTFPALDGHTTQCRLVVNEAPAAWQPCAGAFETTATVEGDHRLEVRYLDDLLNAGSISSATYDYDSTAPAAPVVSLVGEQIRPPGSVTWTWTTPSDATRTECRVIGPGVAEGSVAWGSCTVPRSLAADGVHRFEVRHYDAAGNPSAVGVGFVTVDGTKPSAPHVSATGGRTSASPLTWTLTQTGTDGIGFRCSLVVNGQASAFSDCARNYTFTPTVQGTHRLDVVAVDAAGNLSDVTTGPTWTYDSIGPTTAVVTLPVSRGNTASATWSVAAASDAVRHACRLTRTADGRTSEVVGWTACSSFTFPLGAGDGVYVLEVRSYDDLGNASSVATGPGYTLDATPPAPPTVKGSRDGTTSSAIDVTYTYAGEGTASCALYRDGVLVRPAGAVCGPTGYSVTLPRESGTYRLEVTFTDTFDNTSLPGVSGEYVLDVTPPDVPTVAGNRDGQTDNELAVSYSYKGEGTATCRLYRDGVLVTPTGAQCSATAYTATLPTTSGTYRLEVTFTDAYANTSAPGVSGSYVLDVTPPGQAAVTVSPRTDNVESATWTVTPPEAGTTTECRLLFRGAVVADWHTCRAPYTYALTRGDGEYVLEVRVTDAVGNLGPVRAGDGYTVDMTPPLRPVVTSNRVVKDNERSVTYDFSGEGVATCRLMRDGAPVGSAVVGCTSPYTLLLPNESGVYVLLVTYEDAVGNVSSAGSSPAYDLDVTPPAVPVVTSDRSGTDNERVVSYVFSGEGRATCQLTRNGSAVGAAVECTSPWVVTLPTVDGSYVLLVTYTDAVGNPSAAGASPAYVLDLTPPPAPVVLGPPPTGNSRTVTWTYSGEGTATCQLLLDGAAHGAEFSCGATSFSTTLPSDGSWSLRVSFTDAVGNRGPPGTSSPYLLDTVAPVAPGVSGQPGPAQGRAPSWTVSAEAGTTVECRLLRAGSVVRDWTACSGAYGADLTGLPDGGYVVEARATDRAGNLGAVGTSVAYVLDTTAPLPPSVTGPAGPSQSRHPSFSWTGEPGTSAQCQLSRDGVTVGGWTACSSGYSPTLDRDGTWTLAVRLTDVAGNVGGPAASGGYLLDTTAPPAPVVTPPQSPGRDLAPSWGAVVEGGTTLECRLLAPDGTSSGWAACTLPHGTPLQGRPDGAYVLEVRATDAAGNLSPVGSGRYVLDTVAPAAAVVTAPGSPGRSRTPSFTYTTEAGSTTRCRLTSGATLISDFAPCTSPAVVDLTGLPDGTYTLTVRVFDAAGNPGPAATGTYVLDTTGPEAPVATLSPATPSASRTLRWAFAYESGSTLLCRLTSPSGTVREVTGCTSTLTVDLTGQPAGTWTLTVRAVDGAGNPGAALTLVHVLDATAVSGPDVVGPITPGTSRTPRWTISTATTTECRLTTGTTVVRDWAPCTGSFTADLFGKPDGTYVLSVRTRTATGTASAPTTSRYVLDTTAPAAAVIVGPPTPSTNRLPTWTIASPELGAKAECRVLLFGSVLSDWQTCAVSPGGSLFGGLDLDGRGDGTYTLVVRLLDAAGNRGPEVSSSYVLDTSAPVGVGVTGPPSPGKTRTPTWTFSSSGTAALECRLTSVRGVVSDWDTCAGSFTADLSGLPDGTYTLAVRALSAAGTPGPETTSAYVLSTELPDGPGALTLVGAATGNGRSPTWTFTLPTGTTGYCVVMRGSTRVFAGTCASPFTLDLSRADDGSYTLTVTSVDAAGSESPGARSTYVLDTEPTAAPAFTQVPGSTGSTLDPQWRFTVVYGATAECRLLHGGAPLGDWAPCKDLYTAILTGRPDGRYTLEVRAVDAAGNSSPPRSSSYLLDRTAAPIATFTATPPTPSTDRTVFWTFTAPDGATLECRLVAPDGTSSWQDCAALGGALRVAGSFTVSGSTATFRLDLHDRPNGDYVLEVRVVEADGRRGSVSRATYTLDTRPPAAPVFSSVPPPAGRDSKPRWSWDAGDDLVECRLVRSGAAATAWAPCTSPYEARLSADGTYTLEIRVVDAAGNPSPATGRAYVFDTRPPAAPLLTSRPPASGADRTVSWTFAVPADAEATCTVTRGLSRVDERTCSGGRYDLNLSGMPDGVYTLTVRFTDRAGNAGSPTSARYSLVTVGTGGPGRVDPPSVPTPPNSPSQPGQPSTPTPPSTGGPAPPPPTAPSRGGSGAGPIDVLGGSTSRPSLPILPSGSGPRSAVDRPGSLPPRAGEEGVAAQRPEPQETRRARNPLLADPLPISNAPELLREAVTSTITKPTVPLALLAIVILFLLAQNRIDRRDPKLASAPVEAEPELDFSLIVRRPGGALS